MPSTLVSWPRPHFAPGGGDPFLFFVVFGNFDLNKSFSVSRYRSRGPGEWLEVVRVNRAEAPDEAAEYQSGPLWEQIRRDAPVTVAEAERAPHTVVVRGTMTDPNTLDYFRDAIGLVSWLIDCGGTSIYDPQRLWLWSADEWRDEVVAPGEPQPLAHTVILVSDDEKPETTWLHTRGMRQYGRPDLSVRGVGSLYLDAVTELIERFTAFQALGGVIREGEAIRMDALPPGGVCHPRGSLEDPDFNNFHVAIEWANGAIGD
ncbi:hypothetical protein VT84_39045 [Gemmata sp. SH-PL17]|uniref:hypothetical protein n=1 Tax=Gemmata sp. SH-PL17 TaxID=1630693 RepID=UPI0004B2B1E0|nr:hypothetical protein [Gemmata sp. SH-PL17]AMV30456.1 hypothetical protein VT84_39045 [Gemmata sp. SH-PL17]